MTRKITSLIIILVLVFTMTTVNTFAEGDETTVVIEGTIQPTVVTITAPLSISFSIDPNMPAPARFVSAPFNIINNSTAGVKVTMKNIRKTSEGRMYVVSGSVYSQPQWDNLTKADADTKIALGINDGEVDIWSPAEGEQDNEAFTIFNAGETKAYNLIAKHGLSFSQAFTTTFQILLSYELN